MYYPPNGNGPTRVPFGGYPPNSQFMGFPMHPNQSGYYPQQYFDSQQLTPMASAITPTTMPPAVPASPVAAAVPASGPSNNAANSPAAVATPSAAIASTLAPSATPDDATVSSKDDEIKKLREELQAVKAEMTERMDELTKTFQEACKVVTGSSKDVDLFRNREFDPLRIRDRFIIELRFHDVGKKHVNVAQYLRTAARRYATSNKGVHLVSYYARRVYEDLFGLPNLKYYSSSKKATTHTTRLQYIAVPSTLPECLIQLFCDGFGVTGPTGNHFYAIVIKEAIDDIWQNIFNNARRSKTCHTAPSSSTDKATRKRKVREVAPISESEHSEDEDDEEEIE